MILKMTLCLSSALLLVLTPSAKAQNSSAGTAAPVAAQADAPPVGASTSNAIETVVVTATGRAERSDKVPVSLLAVTGEQLQEQEIGNVETFAIRQPGFRISESPASDYIAIRGIGSSANIGFEQSVGTFVDGVYRGRSRDVRMALFDDDHIEVLRGPQTTFFGNNTIGGALNIVTRKPGSELGADVDAYYSPSYGERSFQGGADLPVNDDLRFRVVVRQSGSDGYVKDANTGQKGPALDDTVGRVAAAWTPSSTVTIDARIDLGRMRDKGVFNIELLNCPPPAAFGAAAGACGRYLSANGGAIDNKLDWNSAANASYFNYDFGEGEVTAKAELGTNTLTSTTGYFGRHYDLLDDPIAVPGNAGGSVVGTSTALPIALGEEYHQVSQELRLASREDLPLSYIAGLYYQHGSLADNLYQGFYFARLAAATGGLVPATTPVAGLVSVTERSDEYSGFVATSWRALERLKINLGARYTLVDKNDQRSATMGSAASIPSAANFTQFSAPVQALLFGPAGIDTGDFRPDHRSDSAFLPSAGVQYNLTRDMMLYGSYSRGFKAGGFSIGTTKSLFEPEHVDAYETGLKASVLDDRINLTLAGFYDKYRDLQETATVLSGATSRQVVTNAARSNSRGIEFGISYRPIPQLTLSTNTTYLHARYEDYPDAPCATLQQAATTAACTQDLSGKDRAFAPRWSGNLSARYAHNLGSRLQLEAEVMPYFSSSYFVVPTADPRLSQAGFTKLDARIALASQDGVWEAAFIGRNLTNVITASYRQVVPGAAGVTSALADPPRSVGLQLRFHFH